MDDLIENGTDPGEDAAENSGFEVAVIGMAGRFPGADGLDQYWHNLCNGVESITTFGDDELLESGIDPQLLPDNFVRAGATITDIDLFDAAFFRYSPREAKTMGPQHRLLLECAYQALEHAGYDARRYPGAIGFFAGESSSSYTRLQQFSAVAGAGHLNAMQAAMGNDRDFLSTSISYKLNLKGPSMTIQSACSTSLVAAHLAFQNLLTGECDMALAGGITVRIPQKTGYLYEKEGIMSPDGHCRAFDAAAEGTVGGEGYGIVVLKRLEDARDDGDCIHAVIRGSALNNDGSSKVGFTAPSIEGQADVISRAQAMGDIDPETIAYIEAHGTGTLLGDPIEIAALTRAFRARGSRKRQYCAIGAVKSNIGHLDAAAGVAGLIKAILVLKHRQIPPCLHYRQPNPQIDFASSPFFVSRQLTDCAGASTPLRAGVSSFGIGGSNVHMVLEAPQTPAAAEPSPPAPQLLLLSARTESALDRACGLLCAHLQANPSQPLADVAYTLQAGREQFQHRRMLVCDDRADAIAALEARDPKRLIASRSSDETRSVVFMFPGQGAQHVDMGRGLYAREPEFRRHFDACRERVQAEIGVDLRELLFADEQHGAAAEERLAQTAVTQPALFALEYALARLWMAWGLRPQAMIGHSIGEYVAACLAGVFSLTDALSLVCRRARLMQDTAAGAMTAVPMAARQLEPLLGEDLAIAAINEASICVVSGPSEAIARFEAELGQSGTECRRLHTSHAFHSAMMEPVVDAFEQLLLGVEINAPAIPYISNLTGDWISAQQVADPAYWSRHLRATVQFAAGLEVLLQNPQSLLLEVGPGQALASLVRRNPSRQPEQVVVASMRHPQNRQPDERVLLDALGRSWLAGVEIDWNAVNRERTPRRTVLPGYPFERKRFWLEPESATGAEPPAPRAGGKIADPARWFYAPGWRSAVAPLLDSEARLGGGRWLVFADDGRLSERLLEGLQRPARELVVASAGARYASLGDNRFTLRPGRREDMAALLDELAGRGSLPSTVLYLWSAAPPDEAADAGSGPQALQDYYSLLFLAQALARHRSSAAVEILVVASGTQAVTGAETLQPHRAALSALCRVIPQEQDRIKCRLIDIDTALQPRRLDAAAEQLLAEIRAGVGGHTVALRRNGRWLPQFETLQLAPASAERRRLRQRGVYLITGGFGNIGIALAQFLAQTVAARLILVGRCELPPRGRWQQHLAEHGDDGAVARRITAVRALEQAGAEVFAASADVADETRMRALIEQALGKFGQIDGVIHAAASNDRRSFQPFHDLDRESCELQFAPKTGGLRVLDRLLEGQTPDFCIVMSSVASVLGGLRFAAYAAANAVADAFVHSRRAEGSLPWTSVNWDAWQFGSAESGAVSSVARLALTPAEGIDAFARILGVAAVPQLVVSTSDLQARLQRWVEAPAAIEIADARSGAAAAPDEPGRGPVAIEFTQQGIERRLVEIWGELLGVDGIGVDDDFFDLGGDSLFALQVTSRLREGLVADLSAASVMEAPTVAGLARHILEQHQAASDADRASDILQQIRDKSPEERQKLLDQARKARSASQ